MIFLLHREADRWRLNSRWTKATADSHAKCQNVIEKDPDHRKRLPPPISFLSLPTHPSRIPAPPTRQDLDQLCLSLFGLFFILFLDFAFAFPISSRSPPSSRSFLDFVNEKGKLEIGPILDCLIFFHFIRATLFGDERKKKSFSRPSLSALPLRLRKPEG